MEPNRFCSVGGNGIKLYSNIVLLHPSAATSRKTTPRTTGIAKATCYAKATGNFQKPGIAKDNRELPKAT